MKKIFVADSYHSNNLAKLLQQFYGSDAIVFCEPRYLPRGLPIPIDTLTAIESEMMTEQFDNKTTADGVDVFFLSAKIILQGDLNPKEMKEQYGNPGAKVIAMSTMSVFLDQVKELNCGVDHFHNKDIMLNHLGHAERLPEEEQKLLREYVA